MTENESYSTLLFCMRSAIRNKKILTAKKFFEDIERLIAQTTDTDLYMQWTKFDSHEFLFGDWSNYV